MDITIIQVIIIIFALFALTRAFLRFKDNAISVWELVLWTAIWVCVMLAAVTLKIFTSIASLLGIETGTNMLVYVSILLLFYLVFRLYVKLENQEQRTTQLIRELTINHALQGSIAQGAQGKNKSKNKKYKR